MANPGHRALIHFLQYLRAQQYGPFWGLMLMLAVFPFVTANDLAAQDNVALPTATVDSSYKLSSGDKVRINIFNQEDLSGEYTLDGNGQFSMPLIGTVDANGLSATELEALLVGRYKPDYLVNPRISVRVGNYRPFYIMGEVKSPNSYNYVDGMSYLTAVAIAGGFTYRAKKDWAYVVRLDDPEKKELKLSISEKVRPGDIIRIAERLF